MSAPCSTPRAPVVSGAECRCVASPSPAASTPISSTPSSSTNGMKVPIAFEPPPTQAIARSGSRPACSRSCARASSPMRRWRSRTSAGYGRGSDAGADHVVGRLHVRDPVADRRGHRLLQRAGAGVDAAHLRAKQSHALHVRLLAAHVLGAHVDDALQPEQRARGCGGHAVLAGAGLGDHARLAHAPREQGLPERVVDLVRARVREVLAFQPHLAARRAPRGASRCTAASGGPRSRAAACRAPPRTRGPRVRPTTPTPARPVPG